MSTGPRGTSDDIDFQKAAEDIIDSQGEVAGPGEYKLSTETLATVLRAYYLRGRLDALNEAAKVAEEALTANRADKIPERIRLRSEAKWIPTWDVTPIKR